MLMAPGRGMTVEELGKFEAWAGVQRKARSANLLWPYQPNPTEQPVRMQQTQTSGGLLELSILHSACPTLSGPRPPQQG